MLSYNADPAVPEASAVASSRKAAKRAHAAHALMLGLHTLCCGLPVAATLLASGAAGLAGFVAFEAAAHGLHDTLHAYELWILAASVALVGLGGLAEWAARRHGRAKGFPAFFAVSLACLALNAALIVSHRTGPQGAPDAVHAQHEHHGEDAGHAH